MNVFKNKTLGDVLETNSFEVGDVLVTKKEGKLTPNPSDPNFTVYFHRIKGIYKPLGDFVALQSAIQFAETFEKRSIINDGYEIIKVGTFKEVILYYPDFTEHVHKVAKSTGKQQIGHAIALDQSIIAEIYSTLPETHEAKTELSNVDISRMVSFGNSLFERYGIMFENRPQRVQDTDIENWIFDNKEIS